jgi:secernin
MCDCLVALPVAASGGVTLFAKNSDRPPHEPQNLEWVPPHRDTTVRTTYLEIEGAGQTLGALVSRPRWCWGVEHGVNEASVAIGNEAIYTTLDPRLFPPALIGMDLVRLGLERGESAEHAVEVMTGLLERHGQGGSGHDGADRPYWSSFLVADPLDAWVLETSGRNWAAERVLTVRAISNRTTIASFDAEHRHPRQPVETLVDPRLAASMAVLASPPVTADALREHLASHAGVDGWTVCMHVPGVEATTASMVAELPASGPAVAWCLLGSPCSSVYVPVEVGEPLGAVPRWERFAALAARRPAALDALAQRLVTERPPAAKAWALVAHVLEQISNGESI